MNCTINDREVKVFATEDGKWHWRTEDKGFWEFGFMDSKPHQFDNAVDAQQDAINAIQECGL